jgi:MFS transporter, PPP family, 3-phenylpropionic acid transporter
MKQWLPLGLFYATVFTVTGISTPFMPVWFRAEGLSGAQIGLILSAPMITRTVTGPLIALWADGFQQRRTPIMLLAAGSALAYGAMSLLQGFWFWFGYWFIASSLVSTLPPLIDVLGLRLSRRDGFAYGWPRGLGSVAFVAANVGMGWVLTLMSHQVVLFATIGFSALCALSAWLALPPEPVHEGVQLNHQDRLKGLGDLFQSPMFLLAILSSGLIQAAHAFYYSFSTLIWQAQAIPASTIGALWGWGVIAEVGFMWFLEGVRRRLGPETMLIIGGVCAVLRWIAMAFAPPVPILFLLQSLHALTFAAVFMASLPLIERYSPPQSASAAQVVNSALSGGLLIGLATSLSGPLFDHWGARGYWAMAAMSLAGLMVALKLRSVTVGVKV